MQTHITPQNKLASLGTVGLLFLAGIAGLVFLLPYAPAHAAATVTLSTITPLASAAGGPTELTGVTSGTVGSSLTLTGTGFASNAAITITTTVGTSTVSWYPTTSQCTSPANDGNNGVDSLVTITSPCTTPATVVPLTTTSVGSFKTSATVPALPGGSETITVSDGTNTVAVPFTVTPKVSLSFTGATNNFGFPEVAISAAGTFKISGFGAAEAVTVATTAFTAASFSTTSCTTSAFGSCTFTDSLTVADTTGGSKSITATGGTSALTASTSYTVKPWAAFYSSTGGATSFSFFANSPTSVLIELHGMSAGTIAANSITVGGVATTHSATTIGSTGSVAGNTPITGSSSGSIIVSPVTNVPLGNTAVVVAGTTFSYAAGNIAVGTTQYGGALIASIAGSASVGTGVVQIDKTSYLPATPAGGNTIYASGSNPAPDSNVVGYFGYGFVKSITVGGSTCGGTGGVITFTSGGELYVSGPTFQAGNCVASGTSPGSYTDSNGAFFAKGPLADTPWSTSAAPTSQTTFSPTLSQAAAAPGNILNPSFTMTPWIDTSKSTVIASTVDYSTTLGATAVGFTAHGFSASESVTFTVGGSSLSPALSCTATSAGFVSACGVSSGDKMPDLAAGPQNLVATGGSSGQAVTSTGAITFDPRIDNPSATGSLTTSALSIVSGAAGTTTILRTGTGSTPFGVHGLYANTAYSIVWNAGTTLPGQTGTVLGTFTSTASGQVPIGGVQFTIPADTAGIHIIDIQRTSTIGTSFLFTNNLFGDTPNSGGAAGDSDSGLGATYGTNFGDMLFNEFTGLVATPTVANVGGSISITGTGLAGNTLYDLGISPAAGSPLSCSTATVPSTIAASFTSSSTGTVPAGTSVVITDTATTGSTTSATELGSLFCAIAQTPANFGTSTFTGTAAFELQANENLNMTTAPIGHNVQLSAHGLNGGTAYNIIFAPFSGSSCSSSTNAICGTVVGALLSNGVGQGSGTFTVPSTYQSTTGPAAVATGQGYVVELQKVSSGTQAIASPATLTVSSVSTTCNTTSCMTANGSPTVTTIGSNKATQTSFTNNSPSPVTAIVYAVVHNAAGQTVAYSTATLTNVPSGGSATAYDVLFGLAPGTYSVTIFATSTSGTAISGTSTVTVTI